MQTHRPRPLILVVDDDTISASVIAGVLEEWADVELLAQGEQTRERALELQPDLILLDVLMPETDGHDVCALLKAEPRTRAIPVIFVSGSGEEAEEARGLLAGAVDYVTKPISAPVLTVRIRHQLELERQRRRLEAESQRDDLTGLANEAHLRRAIELEWKRAARGKQPLAILAAAIDGLPEFTRLYGAPAADECTRRVAALLGLVVHRPGDLIARLLPDRFVVLLPGANPGGALVVAERIRALMRELDLPHAAHGPRARVTLSLGVVAALPSAAQRPEPALQRALQRLELAQSQGLEQIRLDEAPAPSLGGAQQEPAVGRGADRILLVDDDPLSVSVLSELLRGAGYQVETIGDSSRALTEVLARGPDLLLLDLLMPEPGGLEICRQLRANPTTADIPVVFLSVVDDPQQKTTAFEAGGADYIGKSLHPSEVLARIRHQLALQRLQREARQANERLIEASEMKATFVAMLMHDLRAPLGVAQATIELLRLRTAESELQLRELAEISSGGLKNAVALINELLEVYRSEKVQYTRVREPIELADVLHRTLDEARLEARARRVTLGMVSTGSLSTRGDPIRLERAFGNLLANALKHTRAGGQVWIEAQTRVLDGKPVVQIEIHDTGSGIPEAEIPYIFDLYRQAQTGRHGGVGLGLAIVKRILDAHEASISVVSQVGVGTTFTVVLPGA